MRKLLLSLSAVLSLSLNAADRLEEKEEKGSDKIATVNYHSIGVK